eukprot:Hpha_TRINITY_DN15407_c1_g6::TRINITY_DN15407_c1_g6_i1::g.172989::m.172989
MQCVYLVAAVAAVGAPSNTSDLVCVHNSAVVNPQYFEDALDFLCSPAGKVNCSVIKETNGQCHTPNLLSTHLDWAANQYYQANRDWSGDAACCYEIGGECALALTICDQPLGPSACTPCQPPAPDPTCTACPRGLPYPCCNPHAIDPVTRRVKPDVCADSNTTCCECGADWCMCPY